MIKQKKVALILAGGKGTRLWPLSRENYPKQFVEFKDKKSLFQLSVLRALSFFEPASVFFISSGNYKYVLENQIDFLEGVSNKDKRVLKNNLIFEPYPKNTAPAVIFSFKYLQDVLSWSEDDIFYIFPSDHIIEPVGKFRDSLKKAEKLAEKDRIVVFGVRPKSPKPGYGYIIPEVSSDKVKQFIEKPSVKKAEILLTKGAFWNSGIFCFKKSVFLEELKRYKPEMYKLYKLSFSEMAKRFNRMPFDSIDYAVMQKTKKASVVKFACRWSDLGSWDSFLEFYQNKEKNFSLSHTEFVACQDCFVHSGNDKLVSLIGLEGAIVVDTPDSLLVVKKGEADKVKELMKRLNRKRFPHTKDSLTVYRPWGYYTVLKETPNYKVKEIGVYPQKYISLQRHKFRSEHWNVVNGKAEVTIGRKRIAYVHKNESIYVPKGKKHKVYNPSSKTLCMIEVQIGTNLTEEDIQRFDSY